MEPWFTVEHSALLIRCTIVDPYYKNIQNVRPSMMEESTFRSNWTREMR